MKERSCDVVGNRFEGCANPCDVTAIPHVNPRTGVGEDQTFQSINGRIVFLSVLGFEIGVGRCDVKRGVDRTTAFGVEFESDAIPSDRDFDSLQVFVVWQACEPLSSAKSSFSEMTRMFIFRAFWSLFEPEFGSAATRCVTSLLNVSV